MHVCVACDGPLDVVAGLGVPIDDRAPPDETTPLMVAATDGNADAWNWLIRHGANPGLRDAKGRTAMAMDRSTGNPDSRDPFFAQRAIGFALVPTGARYTSSRPK